MCANTLTQSSKRHAGTTPAVLTSPRVGLTPTTPFIAAGTPARAGRVGTEGERDEPGGDGDAPLPELDPPEIRSPPKTLSQAP